MHKTATAETSETFHVKTLLAIAAAICLLILVTSAHAAKPIHAKGGRVAPCKTVKACHRALAWQRKDRRHLRHELAVRWQPSVVAAVRLAANVSGVSFERLWTISGCESTHNPRDVLGQYQGLFQLGRYHRSFPDMRGLSPFDPYANAMHAALFIARHGESQWACRSDGSVAY